MRDGLKPVHRRVLYAMHESGLQPDRPTRKSARVVGDVMGNYHPHGDPASTTRSSGSRSRSPLRYPLIDGQGYFGSVDGDPPAAMRYYRGRLSRIATEMLRDIDADTVDFGPNYDESRREPSVLPPDSRTFSSTVRRELRSEWLRTSRRTTFGEVVTRSWR